MPDKDGKLTEEDYAKIKAWLAQYPMASDSPCPLCGSTEWSISQHLVQPVTLGAGVSPMFGGIGYPQIMLMSNPCGHTRLLNAVIVGILPAAQDTK